MSINEKQGEQKADITPEKTLTSRKIQRKVSSKPPSFIKKNVFKKERMGEWHLKYNPGFKGLLKQIEGRCPQGAIVHSLDLHQEHQGIEQLTTLMSIPDANIQQVQSIILDGIDIGDLETLSSQGDNMKTH